MTTTMAKTYLISNVHKDGINSAYGLNNDEIYEPTWIMFADSSATTAEKVPLIEVYKYINGVSGTQTKSKVVDIEEARAEWRFWIDQGFQRITNTTNKGWKYTEDIRKRTGIEKMASGIKIKPMEKEDDSKVK